MSTFAKKATSAVAALSIVFSIVAPVAGVSASYTSLEAANKLATLGVIVDQSANPADYRLGDTISRREATKVMIQASDVMLDESCTGQFSDLTAPDWGCKYAESALAAGMVAANDTFRPDANVSKIEALKMAFQARALERYESSDWRVGYVDAAVDMGLTEAFTDYDAAATRGQVFVWIAAAIDATMSEEDEDLDDLLCAILGTCEDEDVVDPTDPTDPTEPTDPIVVTGGDVMVSLNPMTPASATIPGNVNGIRAAAFDFTAGDSDVTVSQVSIRRVGLSDQDTLDSIALFTDAGRVSNAKSDNQENDTTAQINLDNGGIVVRAGQTVTLYAVVDVNAVAQAANDEFALEISDVVSSADVTMGTVRGNSMRVGSVDAPEITFTNGGTVTNPNLGAQAADIFEFEINGSDDEDVILRSITFEGSSDAEDNLRNFELVMGNTVVATTEMMVGDYLTFDFGNGLTIEEDKNVDFTVRADVIDGAGDTISFDIDAELDVTANSTKFGFGASVDIDSLNPASITIQAGELTFVEIDAEIDEIREDKDNVVLGSIRVVNVSGQSLEMQEFGVEIELNNGGNAALTGNTGGTLTVIQALEDIELFNVDTGSSYELSAGAVTTVGNVTTATFSDTNIDVALPSGTTTWQIRADTAEDIDNFDDVRINLNVDVANDVVVVETADDEEVTDKTPSSLSFNTIDGSESGAQVNLFPLADIDVVRGSSDVVALQFEVEAEKVSSIVVDEITVGVTGTGGAATKSEIAELKLYKGSVSESNLLDSESISNAGQATFRMGDVMIAANGRQTFVVTLSFVDGTDAVTNSDYAVSLANISIDDDENDDIVITGLPIASARDITVNEAGTVSTLVLDDANADNEFDKLALAGTSKIIASWDVRADNEEVDVETVVFTLSGATNLGNSVTNASLVLNGTVVATNANADISDTQIIFEDVTGLIIPEITAELALMLNTASIGRNLIGESQKGLIVTDISLEDIEGADSGKTTADVNENDTSKSLDIVQAIVTPSIASSFGTDDQNAEIRLLVDGGNNTTPAGDNVQADLVALVIEASSVTLSGAITVFNGNGDNIGTAAVGTGTNTITITLSADSIGNDNETYRIETTAEGTFRLARNGVRYDVDGDIFETKLENTLPLGQYASSN